jgi:hypothetical protein
MLGNQLFQYAALVGVAARRGYDVRMPPTRQHKLASVIPIRFPTYTTDELRRITHRFVQIDADFGYEASLEVIPDWCDIVGHFQSRRHFLAPDQARSLLALRPEVRERAEDFWRTLTTAGRPVVGLMVRRGDYVGDTNFSQLWEEGYYQRAVAHFDDLDPLMLVTSDDIGWCRQHVRVKRAVFAEGVDPPTQLGVLARCDHLVLANSTFSWWAWWYQSVNGGTTVAPARWFPAGSPLDDSQRDRGEGWVEL